MSGKTVYLDNAATTLPKPPQVIKAVADSILTSGNPGRGTHPPSMRAAEEIYACRKAAAELFGASPERVIFTSGATHSLNIAINGLRMMNGAILISDLEHNSVLRPVYSCKKEVRVFSSALSLDGSDRTAAVLDSISGLSSGACALITTAASNICGAGMPIREIGSFCREHGILFIVDGAQAGGVYDIDMVKDNIDILCLPAHKGLYGPMGCGIMLLSEGVLPSPLTFGGSGVDSHSPMMPPLPPERYEAGTLPVPLIAGLRAGIEFVKRKTPRAICEHEKQLSELLIKKLLHLGALVYCPRHIGGAVLFNLEELTPEGTSAELAMRGICTRAGLHCAPLAHKSLGSDGGVRASFGAFNTESDVIRLADALYDVKSQWRKRLY